MSEMKIFVPKYRQDMPHIDPGVLIKQLVEVKIEDLPRIIANWQAMDVIQSSRSIRAFFKAHVGEVCASKPQDFTLEPILRRSHVTFHGGSKNGAESCGQMFQQSAYQSGRWAAYHGFNAWYGGGHDGLMGKFGQGFLDGMEEFGRKPDQYLVQIVPAPFVYPKSDATAKLRPANEGLWFKPHVAIIMPDFDTRMHLLNSRCVAAITNPGGSGSLEEVAGIMRQIKTGLQEMPLYVVNQTVDDEFGGGYYDPLITFLNQAVARGLENPTLLERIHFMDNVENIYTDLMKNLNAAGKTPDQLYTAYCERNQSQPGIPQKKTIHSGGQDYVL